MNDEQADALTPDEIEQQWQLREAIVAWARADQAVLTRSADRQQMPLADGCRNLNEWVASRGDVSLETAAAMVKLARIAEEHPELEEALREGRVTWDRAVAIAPLLRDHSIDDLAGYDLAGIRRLCARQRHLSSDDERQEFAEQYFVVQPSLDEYTRRVHGLFVGSDGHLFEKALLERADEFRDLPHGEASTRTQRQAYALVAMAQDSLDRSDDTSEGNGNTVAVLVDLDETNGTGGEVGAEVEYGSVPTPSPNSSVSARSMSSASRTVAQWSPRMRPKPSHRRCAVSSPTATEAVSSTGAPAATGSNLTTSNTAQTAAATTRTTSPPCAGTTTTSPFTALASASTPTAHPNDDASSGPGATTRPRHRPFYRPSSFDHKDQSFCHRRPSDA